MDRLTLPPYNSEATCPKCGADYARTDYCTGAFAGSRTPCYQRRGEEHLDRRCDRCGFLWLEGVLQRKGQALDPPFKQMSRDEARLTILTGATLTCRNCGADVVPEGA